MPTLRVWDVTREPDTAAGNGMKGGSSVHGDDEAVVVLQSQTSNVEFCGIGACNDTYGAYTCKTAMTKSSPTFKCRSIPLAVIRS